MTDEARELLLYIENDGDLYRQREQPITKNLATKMAKGVYDADKAIKLWMYLMDAGAQKYAREHGTPGTPWNVMFPKAARLEAAKAFNDHFLAEYATGAYASLLPKKYKPKGGKRKHAPARKRSTKAHKPRKVRRSKPRVQRATLSRSEIMALPRSIARYFR